MDMNKHVNKKSLEPKKRVDYSPTPVLITSHAVLKSQVREALKTIAPSAVAVLDPEPVAYRFGIRECIAKADTVKQVEDFLALGAAYKAASAKTRRQWKRTATRRLAQLNTATV